MKRAVKSQKPLRMGISGASGSGKTLSALKIAKALGSRVGLIETEYKSASLYADEIEFDYEEVYGDHHPDRLIKALETHGPNYDVIIVDSLTHFWNGKNGALDLADQAVKRMVAKGGKPDSFSAWKEVTPIWQRVVQAILSCPCHVIVTMRAKQEYSREGGKVQKVGLAPEVRDGFNYELDIDALMDAEHNLHVNKTRCLALDGKMFHKPGKDFADIVLNWLNSGAPAPAADTIPAPPPDPVSAAVSEHFSQFQYALTAARGNAEQLANLRKEIATANSEKRITADEYKNLGKLYVEMSKPS